MGAQKQAAGAQKALQKKLINYCNRSTCANRSFAHLIIIEIVDQSFARANSRSAVLNLVEYSSRAIQVECLNLGTCTILKSTNIESILKVLILKNGAAILSNVASPKCCFRSDVPLHIL